MTAIDTYTVVGEPAGPENWNAYAVELPGVVGNGTTFDAAVEDWTQALALHFETGGAGPETQGLRVRQVRVVRPLATPAPPTAA